MTNFLQAQPRPRPQLVKKKITAPDPENPFQSTDKPAEGTDHAVIASLRKLVEGPPEPFVHPSTPSPKELDVPLPVPPAATAPTAAFTMAPPANVSRAQRSPSAQPSENGATIPPPLFPPAPSAPSLNTIPPMVQPQDQYPAMRPVYPPQDRIMGPGYYPPMAYGQQGYTGDAGFNSMGFDPQRINYQDMVGYHDGGGGVGTYSRELRDPYNFRPVFGGSRDTQLGVYRGPQDPSYRFGFQQAQGVQMEAQDTLPLLPAPPSAS